MLTLKQQFVCDVIVPAAFIRGVATVSGGVFYLCGVNRVMSYVMYVSLYLLFLKGRSVMSMVMSGVIYISPYWLF